MLFKLLGKQTLRQPILDPAKEITNTENLIKDTYKTTPTLAEYW